MNIKQLKSFNLVLLTMILVVFMNCTNEWPESPKETTRPEIVSISPEEWKFQVDPADDISITFSEPMDLKTVEENASFTGADGNALSGSWSSDGNVVTFNPSADLSTLSRYILTINGAYDDDQNWRGPSARDKASNSLYQDYIASFCTEGEYGGSPIYLSAGPNWGDQSTIGRVVDFELETLEGFEAVQGIALNSDGSKLYAADRGGNALAVVATSSFEISTTVSFPDSIEEPWIVGVTPDDTEAWVLCRGTNHLVIVNTSTNAITKVIPLNDYCPEGGFLYRIVFTHDGSKAFISTRLSKSILKFNTSDYELKRERIIEDGEQICELLISPDDSKIYVSNTWASEPSIFVLNTQAEMALLGTIDLTDEWGDAKKFVSFGNYMYVGMRWDAMVYKVDMTTNEVIGWSGWPDEWLGYWTDCENLAMDPTGNVIYQITPCSEAIIVWDSDLNFLGFINTGSWWGIAIP